MSRKAAENVYIRDYQKEDYREIISLWRETGLGGEERGDNQAVIEESIRLGGKLLVLIDKLSQEIIGTSWMTFDGRRIHLHHFGIRPSWQGKGLSHPLVRASLSYAREKGIQIKLEVHQSNLKAISLYKQSGFSYLGDYDVYIIRNPDQLLH
jgi:ribosomal protein S18 acetylase RimI-like enzyme